MAFLIPGTLAEIGSLITAGLAEAGIPESVAGAASGLAVSQIGQKATEGLVKAEEYVLGAENVEKLNNFVSESSANAFDYLTGDYDSLIARNTGNYENTVKHIVAPNATIEPKQVDGVTSKITRSITPDEKLVYNPRQISDLIAGHSKSLADAGIIEHLDHIPGIEEVVVVPTRTNLAIVEELVGTDTSKLGLLNRLSNFYADKSLSKSPEFLEIFRTYTGKGISPENVVKSEDSDNWYFYIIDETGKTLKLIQNKKARTLPPIYGVFGGPLSPNRPDYPTKTGTVPQNRPDTAMLVHDYLYSYSYFHWDSDMRLVANLINMREFWPIEDVKILNSIVIYFATAGSALATLKGSITGDPLESDEYVADDIFPVANPAVADLPKEQYLTLRKEFYKELNQSFKESHKTEGIYGDGSIKKVFDQLKVDLL